MKLTSFMLIFSLVQVSAATFAQKLNLVDRNVAIEKVLREIKKQTNYNVLVESTKFKTSTKIAVNFNNASLEAVMNEIVSGTDMTYVFEDKNIIIKPKERTFFDKVLEKFMALDVTGKVVDEKGLPIPGASIKVKGTNNRTVSAQDGTFALRNVTEDATIEISFIGYKVVELKASQNLNNIKLEVSVGDLRQVDVVSNGYQTLSRERSAGSFSSVDMNVVASRSTSMSVLQSLDGLVPGLVVNNAPNRSQLLIRGISTTGGSTYTGTTAQPLYVVDGLAVPSITANDNIPDIVNSINPQDVESITVLKDATAASIWGARAANGVIVITTKRGKLGGKLRINYNGFVNFQGKPDLDYANLLSSRQFVETAKELFTPAYFAAYPFASANTVIGGGIQPLEYLYYNNGLNPSQAQLEAFANSDNRQEIKDLFYRNAMLTNHTISLSGGGDKYAFYGSGSYTNTVSTVPGEKNNTYKINLTQDFVLNKYLSFNLITDVTNTRSSSKRNLDVDYFFTPYQMFRDADGNNLSIPFMTGYSNDVLADAQARSRINLDYNPLNEFEYGNTNRDGLFARVNGGFKLNIIKGLRAEGTYGYIKGKNQQREYESPLSYTVRKEVATFAVAPNANTIPVYYLPRTTTPLAGGRLTNFNAEQTKWDIRHQLIYNLVKNKHALAVLAGQEAQEQFTTGLTSRVRGFDEILLTTQNVDFTTIGGLLQGTALPNISGVGSQMANDSFGTSEVINRFTSYYANFGYTYDNKYTINASWRNDQSNLFGKDKSAQNKPIYAFGGKWNVGYEAFMKNVNWLQSLAIRATYGITGLSPESGVASSYDVIAGSSSPFFAGNTGTRIVTPGNPDLSWERTATTNLGLDFSVLKNRLSANIDLYYKNSTNLLGSVFPNSLTGFPLGIVGNQGNIKNKGIEVNLSSENIQSRNFSWSTRWTFAYNKSKMVDITGFNVPKTGFEQVTSVYKLGYPAYPVFAYKYGGVDNTGAPQVVLADGTVTKVNNTPKADDMVYMGTSQPVYNGGLTNNFTYKNFTLSANMVYNLGHVMRRPRNIPFGGQFRRNVSEDFLSRWKNPGDEAFTDIPGYKTTSTLGFDINYFNYGDINVVSAGFVKLRDITLFYSVPKFLVSKVRAQGITFRAQVSNVLLWTGNKYGIDPEFAGVAAPNNQNTFTIGANISL